MKITNYKKGESLYSLVEGIQKDERERIGKEFKKWFHSKEIKEDVEGAIKRITGIKI